MGGCGSKPETQDHPMGLHWLYRKVGRCTQQFFGHLGPVAFQIRVVVELVPGSGVVVPPDAEEALERDHHEGDLATHLLDDQALDDANTMTSGVVDRCALDPVAFDEPP